MSMCIRIVTILYTLDMRYVDVNAYREILEALTKIAIWSKKKDRFPGHRDVHIYTLYIVFYIEFSSMFVYGECGNTCWLMRLTLCLTMQTCCLAADWCLRIVLCLSLSLISKAMIAPWVWPRTFHNAEYETHELSYTKQSDDAGLLMVTNSMDFTVCPHAHYHYDEAASASTCTNYVATWVGWTLQEWHLSHPWHTEGFLIICQSLQVVNVSFTDTKLAITSISVTSDDGTTWSVTGTGSEIAVSNGDQSALFLHLYIP